MIGAVTRSRYCGALWSVFVRMRYGKNDLPMMKMSYFNFVHWMTRLAPPRWVQKVKLSSMSMTSEFRLRVYAENFVLSMIPRTTEDNLWSSIWRMDVWDDLTHFVEALIVRVVVITSSSTVVFVSYFISIQVTIITFPVTSRTHWVYYTMWFGHDSWSVVERTCWHDQNDRRRWHVLEFF